LVSALTVFLGFRHDDATQQRAARETFQLEAAKLVMAQKSCPEARQKAITLAKLFPDRLPKDFVNRSSAKTVVKTHTKRGSFVIEVFRKGVRRTQLVSAAAVKG
jgi:hypothetical protein